MKFSNRSAKLGAALVAFVSLVAVAAPASANSWRGDYRSGPGYESGSMVSTRFDGRDEHRYRSHGDYSQMYWRNTSWMRPHHHFHSQMFERHGEHNRFGR
jgi:hypothetical protein